MKGIKNDYNNRYNYENIFAIIPWFNGLSELDFV